MFLVSSDFLYLMKTLLSFLLDSWAELDIAGCRSFLNIFATGSPDTRLWCFSFLAGQYSSWWSSGLGSGLSSLISPYMALFFLMELNSTYKADNFSNLNSRPPFLQASDSHIQLPILHLNLEVSQLTQPKCFLHTKSAWPTSLPALVMIPLLTHLKRRVILGFSLFPSPTSNSTGASLIYIPLPSSIATTLVQATFILYLDHCNSLYSCSLPIHSPYNEWFLIAPGTLSEPFTRA